MSEKRLQPVEIFDWYDGMVLAVVRPSWMVGLSVASLIYWAQSKRLRVYAILPISEVQARSLTNVAKNWTELRSEVTRLAAGMENDVAVICVEESTGSVVGETRVRASVVAPLVPTETSEALNAQREWWLNSFEIQPL